MIRWKLKSRPALEFEQNEMALGKYHEEEIVNNVESVKSSSDSLQKKYSPHLVTNLPAV